MEGWKLPAGSQGAGPSVSSKQRNRSSWQLFPGASPTQLCGPPKAFEKVQAHPQASLSSPSPSSELHGSCPTAQARSSWGSPTACLLGKTVKKTIALQMSHPMPFSEEQGAPVSFLQAYLQLLLPLPSQPHPSLSMQLFPLAPWAPGKALPPIVPSLCCQGLRRTGNTCTFSERGPTVYASTKPHVDMIQPAPSTQGSRFQLMPMVFPSLQHPITEPVWSLLEGALTSYQSPTTGY